MIRWTEVPEGYRVTVSPTGRVPFIAAAVMLWLLLLLAFRTRSQEYLRVAVLGGLLAVPGILYAIRGMRHGAWVEVVSQGGYARWATTGLAPRASPVAVARFKVNFATYKTAEIVAELLDGSEVVVLCRNDMPAGTDVWAIVARLNELLSPTEWKEERGA